MSSLEIQLTTTNVSSFKILFHVFHFPKIFYYFLDAIGIFYIVSIGVLNSVSPLILQIGAEMTAPISEDIMAGVINQANNFIGVIFYLSFSYFTTSNDDWLMYSLMIVPVLTLLVFSVT